MHTHTHTERDTERIYAVLVGFFRNAIHRLTFGAANIPDLETK